MEISRRITTITAVTASALSLAACGTTIVENSKISNCEAPSGLLLEATTDPSAADYKKQTDPAILAAEMEAQADHEARAINDRNEKAKWYEDQTYARIVVGVGEVACEADDGKVYLTIEGTKLSSKLEDS